MTHPQNHNCSNPSHAHAHSHRVRPRPKVNIDVNPLTLARASSGSAGSGSSGAVSSPASASSSYPSSPSSSSRTRTMSMSWDDILMHAGNKPCGGTALGSNVKGPCKPIGRTDGVVVCWWCSRWLGTFETWNPPQKPPMYTNVYDSHDDYADGFFA